MDSVGSIFGTLVGIGALIWFALFIMATVRSGIAEQREINALGRTRREAKRAGQRHGGGRSRQDYGAFVASSLEQMLLSGNAEGTLSGQHLLATDGTLHTYEQLDVDWRGIWRAAAKRTSGIPPFGARPYWTPSGPGASPAPFSVLAFFGASARLRLAIDPTTDRTALAMMAGDQYLVGMPDPRFGDPDVRVQAAAASRL